MSVAEEGGSTVVVGVEEGWDESVEPWNERVGERTERFLFENHEYGIEKFEVFGQVVELEKVSLALVIWTRGCTNVV